MKKLILLSALLFSFNSSAELIGLACDSWSFIIDSEKKNAHVIYSAENVYPLIYEDSPNHITLKLYETTIHPSRPRFAHYRWMLHKDSLNLIVQFDMGDRKYRGDVNFNCWEDDKVLYKALIILENKNKKKKNRLIQ